MKKILIVLVVISFVLFSSCVTKQVDNETPSNIPDGRISASNDKKTDIGSIKTGRINSKNIIG